MSYNKENYSRIKQEYLDKSLRAERKAEERIEILCAKYRKLARVQQELSHTGIRIMNEAMRGSVGLEERIDALKAENEKLLILRSKLLEEYGYPPDYFMPRYECDICKDEGYENGKMCICMKRAIAAAAFESSGLGTLAKKQNFDNFSLEYYDASADEYGTMKQIFECIKEYAENFGDGEVQNLLLIGPTGLGKTHLSTSAAAVIINKGYDVVYDSAVNIFGAFEHERFNRAYNSTEKPITDKYFDCDLLIIDDLGVETTNQFTVSCLYNLINTRLASDKAMIINTNLTLKEIRAKYDARIVSRLLGEFNPHSFCGTDVRLKKLRSIEC